MGRWVIGRTASGVLSDVLLYAVSVYCASGRVVVAVPHGLRTLDIATNILRHCWRHMCFDKATALCVIL